MKYLGTSLSLLSPSLLDPCVLVFVDCRWKELVYSCSSTFAVAIVLWCGGGDPHGGLFLILDSCPLLH